MAKFAMPAPPQLLKGDTHDMRELHSYLTQLIDALCMTLNNLDASNVRRGGLVAASFSNLTVEILKAAKAEIGRAQIGFAQVQHLEAKVAELCTAVIQTADVDWAHIKDLATDRAIITKGVNGKLYVTDLAVTEANMVSLTTGELVLKGADGRFYALTVDADGNVTTELKQVENGDVKDLSINAGEKIIEGSVTAACLNAKDIFADNALIRQLMAANIDVDTLFGREATLEKINALDIRSNAYLKLMVDGYGTTYTQYERPQGEFKPGDRWIQTAAPALTWADLGGMTWEEIGSKQWGAICSAPKTWVWDGECWRLTSDEPGRVENSSLLIDHNGIRLYGGYILIEGGTQIRIVSGGALDVDGGDVNIRAGGRLNVEGGEVDIRSGSALRVKSGGVVDVDGGDVNIRAKSRLNIDSGGAVRISAGDSEESYINFGEAFAASKDGMSAESGSFGDLKVAGKRVLTEDKMPMRVVVSATEPTGSGLIWLKPETVSTAEYKADTGVNRNKFFYEADQTLSLAAQSSDTMTSGTFAYRVAFTVLLINDGSAEKNVVFSVSAAKGAKQVNFPAYTLPSIKAWQQVDVEIEVESTTSLCGDTGAINVTIGAANLKANNLCLQKNTQVMLTVTNRSASGSVQPCSIYYKP